MSAARGDDVEEIESPPAWRTLLARLPRPRLRVDPDDEEDPFEDRSLSAWLALQVEIERKARTGFFLVPLSLMLGIVFVYGEGARPAILLLVGMAALALTLALKLDGGAGITARIAFFVLAGMVLAEAELARVQTTIFSGEATVRVEGLVTWRDVDETGHYRYRLRLLAMERPHLSRPPEVVQIFVSSRHEPLPVGGIYKGLVRLRPPSGPAYPGAYDFAFGPFFEGIGAYGFSLGPPEPGDQKLATPPSGWAGFELWLTRLRLTISDRIRSAIGGAEGAVASALITGERSGIPDDVNLWLRAVGLSHVLSISGLHLALVAGFTMTVMRALLAAMPSIALVHPTKKYAAIVALGVSTFYVILAGNDVALLRSYVMLLVMLLSILFDRPALTLRNVGLAAVFILVTEPHSVMSASFQMSFAATTALVGVYGAFARSRHRDAKRRRGAPSRPRRLLAFFVGLGASSLIAGLATAPYAAYHFQRIAPFGLVANLLALPIFSVWIMPLALLSMLAMPFGLDQPLLWLMGKGLALVFAIAHAIYQHIPDAPTGRMMPSGLVFLTLALLAFTLLASRLKWAAVPLAAAGLVLALPWQPPPELLVFEDGKELAVIDAAGRLAYRKERPNGFVSQQWERSFVASAGDDPPDADRRSGTGPPGFICTEGVCRATTRSGLRVLWTDDYRKTGLACDEADVAIVARAIRLQRCRFGALLVTLRTLRRTGSLAISRSAVSGLPEAATSIDDPPREWNLHRLAPWPEYWRKPPGTSKQPKTRANDDAD